MVSLIIIPRPRERRQGAKRRHAGGRFHALVDDREGVESRDGVRSRAVDPHAVATSIDEIATSRAMSRIAMTNAQLIQSGTVARILGVSATRVRQLDDELTPIVTAEGRRLYDPEVVHAFAARRDYRKATR